MEGHVKKVSNFRCAIQVSYVAVRQWLEILINEFLIEKLSVSGGEWWWIYFGWWWVMVDIFWLVMGGGGWRWTYFGWWWTYFGWWRVVVDRGGSWWVVA